MPKFNAEVSTAEAEGRLLFYGRELRTTFNRAIQELATDGVLIMQAHAPQRSRRLFLSIRDSTAQGRASGGRFGSGLQLAITAKGVSPKGYDYTAVTRFGHRVAVIRSKSGGYLSLPPGGGYPRLRVKEVTPRKVTHDWAEAGARQVFKEADRKLNEVGRRMELVGR